MKTNPQPMIYLPSHAMSALEFERAGNEWQPQVHLTGAIETIGEIGHINFLIRNYGCDIVAHYIYCPIPGMYSVELQFFAEERAAAFQKEYSIAFTPSGKLRPIGWTSSTKNFRSKKHGN